MTNLIIRYRLKDGVTPQQFEDWVRSTDQPTMRGLRRVKAFNTYRVTGLLMGEGQPASAYYEVFEIDDLAGFTSEDMAGDVVQKVLGAFMGLVVDAEFNIAEAV